MAGGKVSKTLIAAKLVNYSLLNPYVAVKFLPAKKARCRHNWAVIYSVKWFRGRDHGGVTASFTA